MLYVFDMDYTLVDTVKFKEGLIKVFGSGNLWYDSYNKFFKELNNGNANFKVCYNPDKHLDLLFQDGQIDARVKEKIKKNLDNFWNESSKYLFSEAIPVLKSLKNKGHDLIFFSYGDKEYNKQKIDNLKIKEYFSEIILVDQNKENALDFLKDKEGVVIVNDNAKECVKIKESLPKAEIFLVQGGPYLNNIEHNFPIRKLEDLL